MHRQRPSKRIQQNVEPVYLRPQHFRVTRGTSLSQFVSLSLLVSALVFMGLTTRAQDSSKEKDSGFLGDYYSRLQPDPDNPDLLTYWKNKDVLKSSSKFILDPITIYLLPEAQQRGIDPEQLANFG